MGSNENKLPKKTKHLTPNLTINPDAKLCQNINNLLIYHSDVTTKLFKPTETTTIIQQTSSMPFHANSVPSYYTLEKHHRQSERK